MRILHIQFAGPYTENMGYQENILPKYHQRLGNEVYILTSCYAWKNSKIIHVPIERKKMKDGVFLERMEYENLGIDFLTEKLRAVRGVEKKLEEINPDFIMLHDVQSFADYGICAYLKKHPQVRMIVDCHTDFENSARNWISKNILHKVIWRHLARKLIPFTDKFYGVLPARVDFLSDVYKVPREKCDLLVMGGDDELIELVKTSDMYDAIRGKYNIHNNDFLIVTGGKINQYRQEPLDLMEAVKNLSDEKIRIIFFGSIQKDFSERFNDLVDDKRIINAGWLNYKETYSMFEAADLVFFPGAHSAMWEQAVSQGKVCVFRDIQGFHHVDVGGNAVFISDLSVDNMRNTINRIVSDKDNYLHMKKIAENVGMKVFSYNNIANRSIN